MPKSDSVGGPLDTEIDSWSARISRNRLFWLMAVAILFVGLDQASKTWAQQSLAIQVSSFVDEPNFVPAREIVVVPKVLNFIYRENPAAAFSLTRSFPDWFRRPFLLIVSGVASLFFLIWYFRIKEDDILLLTSFCLIMAGAAGNLIDRATLGYVIDFIDVHGEFLGFPGWHWPTFNIADSCIVVGAIGILIRSITGSKKSA